MIQLIPYNFATDIDDYIALLWLVACIHVLITQRQVWNQDMYVIVMEPGRACPYGFIHMHSGHSSHSLTSRLLILAVCTCADRLISLWRITALLRLFIQEDMIMGTGRLFYCNTHIHVY